MNFRKVYVKQWLFLDNGVIIWGSKVAAISSTNTRLFMPFSNGLENAYSIIIILKAIVYWQSSSWGECWALVSSAGPPGGAVEVDLPEGRGAGQADARRRRRPHPAAAAEPLHGTFCHQRERSRHDG